LATDRAESSDRWRRHVIVPGVELHIREEVAAKFGNVIDQVVAIVRSLLSHP